ncbi:MAG: MBL fold metallo-hydrolase [Spirochaetaceae bacterium]|nr:MBL fold metallo-hydrolase [Spirochaetaceae bacterium]
MPSITFFKSEEIAPKSWKICNGFVAETNPFYCYLVEGRDYALLIDTMMGWGNLNDFCKTLTDKPVKIVNTHAHWDHIGGNFNFDSCYLHPRDIALFNDSVNYTKQQIFDVAKQMAKDEFKNLLELDDNYTDSKPMKIFPVYGGDEFDLGDKKIEVIEVGGHTAGSIVLIDRKTRIAYSGDACNSNTLLELPTSLPVAVYMKSLLHLKEFQPEFDMMYGGHEILDATIIDEAIETVAKVIAGTDDHYEAKGMFGTPVFYAAARVKNGSERVDGKRFNMSYVSENIFEKNDTRQIIR